MARLQKKRETDSSKKSEPSFQKIKTLKRRPYRRSDFKPRLSSFDAILDAANRYRDSYYYRENLFGREVIWDRVRFVFPSEHGLKRMSYLFIFAMVKREALKYLETHTIKKIEWAPSIIRNKDFIDKGQELIGYDVDAAYWQIARKLNIISEKTFKRGQDVKYKNLLLASLASLGSDKRYVKWKEGVETDEMIIVKGNDDLKNVYKMVRYYCFRHMRKMAKILGRHFVAYKTDCIYFVRTKKNIKAIEKYLDAHNLEFKRVGNFNKFLNSPD